MKRREARADGGAMATKSVSLYAALVRWRSPEGVPMERAYQAVVDGPPQARRYALSWLADDSGASIEGTLSPGPNECERCLLEDALLELMPPDAAPPYEVSFDDAPGDPPPPGCVCWG